jgi:hypothetical protein
MLFFPTIQPLGGALSQKILNPMLLGPASAGRLQKPLSVIIIVSLPLTVRTNPHLR